MKKKFKGFTLVELIVVIAIIGVLAAILVPNMMGYINKSKLSSANTAAKNVSTAITTYVADQESMGNPVPDADLTACQGAVSSAWQTAGKVQGAVYTALEGNTKMGVVYVTLNTVGAAAKTPCVVWADDAASKVWGQYPNAQADYATWKAKCNSDGAQTIGAGSFIVPVSDTDNGWS